MPSRQLPIYCKDMPTNNSFLLSFYPSLAGFLTLFLLLHLLCIPCGLSFSIFLTNFILYPVLVIVWVLIFPISLPNSLCLKSLLACHIHVLFKCFFLLVAFLCVYQYFIFSYNALLMPWFNFEQIFRRKYCTVNIRFVLIYFEVFLNKL